MIEIACLGLSGSTQSMRVRTRAYKQTFVHSSDRLQRDRSAGAQARSGWIRGGREKDEWLVN